MNANNYLMDTLERDRVLFKVRTEPLFHEGKAVEGKFAQVRDDNNDVIGIVGKNYKTVDHVETLSRVFSVLSPLSPAMDIRHVVIRGGKIITEFRMKDLQFLEGKESSIPSVVIKNSYDGSSRYESLLGVLRMCCGNGSFLMDTVDRLLRSKHNWTLDESRMIAELPESIRVHTSAYQVLYKTLDGMEIVAWADPSMAKIGKHLVKDAEGLYVAENGNSRWNQYNAFTNILSHREVNPETKFLTYQALNQALIPA